MFQNDLSASLHDLWEWDVRSLKRCRLSMRYFVQLLQCQLADKYNQHHIKCVGYSKYIESVSAVYLNNFLKVTILRNRLFTNKGYLSSLKPLVSPQFNSLKPEGSAYRTSWNRSLHHHFIIHKSREWDWLLADICSWQTNTPCIARRKVYGTQPPKHFVLSTVISFSRNKLSDTKNRSDRNFVIYIAENELT